MGIFAALTGNAGVVDPGKLNEEYGMLLADGEEIQISTDKRFILVDVQGITGACVDG